VLKRETQAGVASKGVEHHREPAGRSQDVEHPALAAIDHLRAQLGSQASAAADRAGPRRRGQERERTERGERNAHPS